MAKVFYSEFYPNTGGGGVEGSTVPVVTTEEAGNYNAVIDGGGLKEDTVPTDAIVNNAVTRMSSMTGVSNQVMTSTEVFLTGTFGSGEYIGDDEFGNPIYSSTIENLRSTFTSIAGNSLVYVIACISAARVAGDDDTMTLRCIRRTGSDTGTDVQVGPTWTVRAREGQAVTTYVFYDSPDSENSYTYYLKGRRDASSGSGPDLNIISITAILGQR